MGDSEHFVQFYGQVEGDQLAQRLRMRESPVQPEAHERCRAQAEQRDRAHGASTARSGGPVTSSPSASAIVSSIGTSMSRISGLAIATG